MYVLAVNVIVDRAALKIRDEFGRMKAQQVIHPSAFILAFARSDRTSCDVVISALELLTFYSDGHVVLRLVSDDNFDVGSVL